MLSIVAESAGELGTGTAVGIGAIAAIAVGGVIKMGMVALRGRINGRPNGQAAMFDKGRCDAHGRKLDEQSKQVGRNTTDIEVLKTSLGNFEKKQDQMAVDVRELLRRVPE
jgi:hypothetical protein